MGTPPALPAGEGDRPEAPETAGREVARALGAFGVVLAAFTGALLIAFYFGNTDGVIAGGGVALLFPLSVRRWKLATPVAARTFVLASATLAVFSVLSAVYNGLTDEPYTTPRYAGLFLAGKDAYSWPLVFTYTQPIIVYHGGLERVVGVYPSHSYYVYLPLLTFVQIPGLDYRWFALGLWAAMVYLVRTNLYRFVVLGGPYVALMAASGYNDFPGLLLLTLAFVGVAGRRSRVAELLALGFKQFANVVVIAYHIARREWRGAAVAVGVTLAFVAPFIAWNPTGALCSALPVYQFTNPLVCPERVGSPFAWNYWLYPLWVVAVFPEAVRRWGLRVLAWLRIRRLGPRPSESAPSARERGPG